MILPRSSFSVYEYENKLSQALQEFFEFINQHLPKIVSISLNFSPNESLNVNVIRSIIYWNNLLKIRFNAFKRQPETIAQVRIEFRRPNTREGYVKRRNSF